MLTDNNDMMLSLGILIFFGVQTIYTVTNRSEKITDALLQRITLNIHLFKLFTGILLLGITPLLFIKISYTYLRIPAFTATSAILLLILSITIFSAGYAAAKKFTFPGQADLSVKPALALYFPLRIFFLTGYELFFRGTLLPLLLTLFSVSVSVAITTFFYALMHAGNGNREWAGAIPFGLALCILTLKTESVWPAVCLHLLLAMSYEPIVIKKFFAANKTAVI